MPSITHQILVSLIRDNPSFSARLFEHATGKKLPKRASLQKNEAQFTDLRPPEYSADAAYLVRNARGRPLRAVIYEVQLERKHQKRQSWLQYVINCHVQLNIPVTLVVIALTDSMARWCRERHVYDPLGNNTFCPVVLGPSEIPRITDLNEAVAMPALAFLSVAAHGKQHRGEEVALAAVEACATLPEEKGALFYDFIRSSLSQAALRALEEQMLPKYYQPQSKWAKQHFAQGLEQGVQQGLEQGVQQGLEQGVQQGLEQGVQQGLEQGKRNTLLKQLGLKYGEVPESLTARINQAELTELDRWLERLLTASSLGDVFA